MPRQTCPLNAPVSLLLMMSALALITQACWDTPTACSSDAECFLLESCVQSRCILATSMTDMSRGDGAQTLDMARLDMARLDMTRPDMTRPDMTAPDMTRPDMTRPDMTRPDMASPDMTAPDMRSPDMTPADPCAQVQCQADLICDPATGRCVPKAPMCGPGEHLCADRCVPDDAVTSCGQRCEPCPGADLGQAACVQGQCALRCPTGTLECQGACAPCPSADPQGSLVCQQDLCVLSCQPGWTRCPGGCCPPSPPSSGVITPTRAARHGVITTAAGRPLVAFDDAAFNPTVKLATLNAQNQWTIEDIGPGQAAGPEALAWDSQGQLHVALLSRDGRTARVATRQGNAWLIEDAVTGLDEDEITSLSLRASGQGAPQLAVANGDDIIHAARSSAGPWRATVIFDQDGNKRGVSLDYLQGQPRVSYRTAFSAPNIRYSRLVNGQWDTQRLTNNVNIRAEHLSLIFSPAPANLPFIFMDDELTGRIRLLSITANGAWQLRDLTQSISPSDALEDEGLGNAVYAPVKNVYYIAYHDSFARQASLLTFNGSTVQRATLGAIAPQTRPAVASDTSGAAHVVFVRSTGLGPVLTGRDLYYDYRP